ncbi:MAG: flavin reductase [Elusimicrobiota bacterium]|jgi:flavin reductase (DIM6/NTAB) family NADH-FMN oxidoreductase RutF|nr:flavin reductase [Elusimicrobiota bacterium]
MENYEKISAEGVNENAAKLIGQGWMLITAGNEKLFNSMTASWGTLGHLWNKNIATIFIRPQRYTKEFVDKESVFTLSFFKEIYRPALQIYGTKSGRDCDKVKEAGITPIATPNASIAFSQAYMVMECKKLYAATINESSFLGSSIVSEIYPQKDFHDFYIGEILGTYIKIGKNNG